MERELADREAMLQLLRFHLHRAQHRMVHMDNKHRTERSFYNGDWVYVKLQLYRQNSVEKRSHNKLNSIYYGPYRILDKVGKVSYMLELPEHSQVHRTFHVSKLRKSVKEEQQITTTLPGIQVASRGPEFILDRRMVKRGNGATTKVLVQWKDSTPKAATWEFVSIFKPSIFIAPLKTRMSRRGKRDAWKITNRGVTSKEDEWARQ